LVDGGKWVRVIMGQVVSSYCKCVYFGFWSLSSICSMVLCC
jgi:hypothetical protein